MLLLGSGNVAFEQETPQPPSAGQLISCTRLPEAAYMYAHQPGV